MRKLISLFLCFLLIGCGSSETTYTTMSMKEAIKEMENSSDFILVDVRTWEEYEDGHIPNAICIPNESIKEEVVELKDKNQKIYVYCRSGNRSKQTAQKLIDLGYTNVIEIGGIIDYTGEIE